MEKAAEILRTHKDELVDVWVKHVREEMTAPKQTADLALRNHIPILIDDLVNIMESYEGFEVIGELEAYKEMLEHSIGHGRHRAASSGYDVEQILGNISFFTASLPINFGQRRPILQKWHYY